MPWRSMLKVRQMVPHLSLGLGCIVGTIGALGVGAELGGDLSQDLQVALDPTGGSAVVPVRMQGVGQGVEPGRGVQPLFF